jgi:hypothetical protein
MPGGQRLVKVRGAVSALLAVLAVGCGGGSSSSGPAAPKGPTAAQVCARIPSAYASRLAARAAGRAAPAIGRSARGTAALIQCGFIRGGGTRVDFSLDLAQDSRQRFDNRITEMSQFSTYRNATLPRPVRGVGDARAGDEGAQWIPALDQLLAYRPGRYLIVDFSVAGAADAANRAGAAALARFVFPRMPRSPLPDLSHIPRSVGG